MSDKEFYLDVRLIDRAVSKLQECVRVNLSYRTIKITAFCLPFIFLTLYLSTINSYWKITPDSTTYVLAGQSLAEGEGYKERGKKVYLSPPMTSTILGISHLVFPNNYFALNMVTTLFTILSLYLFFLLFKKDIGTVKSALLTSMAFGSTVLFKQSTFLLSESFYMFFSALALITFRYFSEKDSGWLHHVIMGITVLLLCMTRIIGVSLLAAIMLHAIFRLAKYRERSDLLLLVSMLLVASIVLLWEFRGFQSGSWFYAKLFFQKEAWVDELGLISLVDLPMRFFRNVPRWARIEAILTNNLSGIDGLLRMITMPISLLLFFSGLVGSNKKPLTISRLYVVNTLLIIALYQPDGGLRFFGPLVPFIFFFSLMGYELVIQKIRDMLGSMPVRIVNVVAVLYISLYLGYGMSYMLREIPIEHSSPFKDHAIKYTHNYDAQRLGLWLKEHSAIDDAFMCMHPNIMELIVERKAYHFPFTQDSNRLLAVIEDSGIHYVLADKKKTLVQHILLPVMNASPDRFKLIKDEKHASLYEVISYRTTPST